MITFNNLSFHYEGAPLFSRLNLSIASGELTGIIGSTGSGKTTLLKLILGLLRPVSGELSLKKGKKKEKIGYVPQVEKVDRSFPVTAEEVISMGGHSPWRLFPSQRKLKNRVASLMERLEIEQCSGHAIGDLSGGQQQRVLLARALVKAPSLLILDEPTAGIDVKTRDRIMALLEEENRKGVTILLTTHDLEGVGGRLPRVICFNRGVVAQGKPKEVFTPRILEKTFGGEMVISHRGGEWIIRGRH